MRLKLKAIKYNCDFRQNEVTLYNAFRKDKNFPGELANGECYLFISGTENQVIWYLRSVEVQGSRTAAVGVTHTQRSRLNKTATWNPLMLAEYALAVGITLIGIRSFEAAFKEQRAFKTQQRDALKKAKELAEQKKAGKLPGGVRIVRAMSSHKLAAHALH